jgi:hypothetical protein
MIELTDLTYDTQEHSLSEMDDQMIKVITSYEGMIYADFESQKTKGQMVDTDVKLLQETSDMLSAISEDNNKQRFSFVRVMIDDKMEGFNVFDKTTGNSVYFRNIKKFENIKAHPTVKETIIHDDDDRQYGLVYNKKERKLSSPHCLKYLYAENLIGTGVSYSKVTTFTQSPYGNKENIELKRTYQFATSIYPIRPSHV